MPSIITLNAVSNISNLQNGTGLINNTVYANTLRDWVISSNFGSLFASNSIPSGSLQTIQGTKIQTSSLSGASFTNGQIARRSITEQELADNAVVNRNITTGTIGVDKINASGTRGNTTFLRGDGQWAAVTSPSAGSGISVSTSGSTSTIAVNFATLAEVTGTNPPTAKSVSGKVLVDVLGGATLSNNYVTIGTNQTITGTKTFNNTIVGSINGNAATVTNGVYTSGSYNNPAWITALAGSKITGSVASANAVADGVYLGSNQTITGSKTFTNEVKGNIFNAGGASSSVGRCTIRQGTSTRAGYVEWFKGNGTTRIGYMGFNNADLNIVCEDSNILLISAAGGLRCTGNITAFFSDERLKTFLGKIPNALEKVSSLNGYYFKENEKAKTLGYINDKVQIGVNAQEVERVLPEVVTLAPIDSINDESGKQISKSGENIKTVYYDKLVPLLIEAIKELNDKVKNLEAKLNS